MKKKLIQQGLLDGKGKPNEKTPPDWYKQYVHYSHFGEADKAKSGKVAEEDGDASMADISTAKSEVDNGESPPKKKRKKDKKKKDEDKVKEEDSS